MLRAGAIIELNFIDKMKALGYQSDANGICFGGAYIGMLAMLAGNVRQFNDLIVAIFNLSEADVKALKNKKIAELTQNEINMLALCDSIEVMHIPDLHMKLFEPNKTVTQEKRLAQDFVIPSILETQGGIKESVEFSDVYTLSELTNQFARLTRCVIDANCSEPFVLLMESNNHTISLRYDANKDIWTYIDMARMPIHEIRGEGNLAEFIFESFYAKQALILSTSVYHKTSSEEVVKRVIKQWKNGNDQMEDLIMKASSTDSFGATLLHTAARRGQEDLTLALLVAGADVDQATTDTGVTPLYLAVQENHLNVVNHLLTFGADPNKKCLTANISPLGKALESKNWLLAVAMLVNTKPESKIDRLDIEIIHKNRHILAEAFCKLMGHEYYQGNYKQVTQDVLNGQNALGKILAAPTDLGGFWLSDKKYHGAKVTGSIKIICDWYDKQSAEVIKKPGPI